MDLVLEKWTSDMHDILGIFIIASCTFTITCSLYSKIMVYNFLYPSFHCQQKKPTHWHCSLSLFWFADFNFFGSVIVIITFCLGAAATPNMASYGVMRHPLYSVCLMAVPLGDMLLHSVNTDSHWHHPALQFPSSTPNSSILNFDVLLTYTQNKAARCK